MDRVLVLGGSAETPGGPPSTRALPLEVYDPAGERFGVAGNAVPGLPPEELLWGHTATAIDGGRTDNGTRQRLQRLVQSLEGLPVPDRNRLQGAIRKLDAWGADLLEASGRSTSGPGAARDVMDAQLAELRSALEAG